jgi:phosphoribosylformylglycinamidine synthase
LPLAVTDNLNFGNPQKPEIMGEIVGAIDGIGDACRALDFPVISGNCSLYNETNGEGILPTPAIGAVGLLKDVHRMATIAFKREGDSLVLIGPTYGHLGQSIYLREIEGEEEGASPTVGLELERRNGEFVRSLIEMGTTDTVHDISDGGLLVALAEMAIAGNIGCKLNVPSGSPHPIAFLFGEDQARYILAVPPTATPTILSTAHASGVQVTLLGTTIGDRIAISGFGEVTLAKLKHAHEAWFPAYMSGGELPPTN